MYQLKPLGFIKTCFPEKFGIPRQSLLAPSAEGELILQAPYNNPDCVEGLEHSSHLWLTFIFHQHLDEGWKPKVRPPRLGGNKKCGVFATRSSFRPNHLGFSVVKLDKIDTSNNQVSLYVSGVDLVDGTPIVDIKPYLPYADSLPQAINTMALDSPPFIDVTFSNEAKVFLQHHKNYKTAERLLVEILQQDPRPAYQKDESDRLYKTSILDLNVEWCYRVNNNQASIEVLAISKNN